MNEDEIRGIVDEVIRRTAEQPKGKEILLEMSARHVHVTQEHLEILFGEGYELTKKKDLSQPGQFACAEKITVVGPRGELAMSILGPYRNADQVEVSLTDARKIGIVPPIRESGELAGTPGCKLVGPKGELEIDCGVIAAQRHVHLTPEDAEKAGLYDILFGMEDEDDEEVE